MRCVHSFGIAALGLTMALISKPAAAGAQTERGAFIVTLGRDTVAIDQYARAPRFIDGSLLVRIPVTRVVSYKVLLAEHGHVRRIETRWWTPHPEAGPPQPPDAIVTFDRDSAVVEYSRGDESSTIRLAAPRGTVPLVHSVYSMVLYEQVLRQDGGMGRDTLAVDWLALDQHARVSRRALTRRGRDSVAIEYFAGTLVARTDTAGHILGLTGQESTAKITVHRVAELDLEPLAAEFGARDATGQGLGTMSPRDSVSGVIAGASLEVDYSRPAKRGRVIWGGVVPWHEVWRTGANWATHFTTDRDLLISGVTVPAGRYTLYTMPEPGTTRLIINRQTGQWGTVYDPDRDLARIPMRSSTVTDPVERFTFILESTDEGGMLGLSWDDRLYWVPFTVTGNGGGPAESDTAAGKPPG